MQQCHNVWEFKWHNLYVSQVGYLGRSKIQGSEGGLNDTDMSWFMINFHTESIQCEIVLVFTFSNCCNNILMFFFASLGEKQAKEHSLFPCMLETSMIALRKEIIQRLICQTSIKSSKYNGITVHMNSGK